MLLNRYLARVYLFLCGIRLHSSVKILGPINVKGKITSKSLTFGKNIVIQPNVEIKLGVME